MSTKAIDQKAYLHKYLSGPSADKKKKKKKKVVRGSGFSIIDDDLDLSKMRTLDDDELEVLDGGDDAPQIAGIIDERPEELKILEQFKTGSKWRIVNQDDGFSSKLQIEEVQMDVKKKKKENELIFGKLYSDSEDDDAKNGSDLSPPRVQHTDYGKPDKKKSTKRQNHSDSDCSPPRKNDRGMENRKQKSNKREESPQRKSRKDMSSQKRSTQAEELPSKNRTQSPKNHSKNMTNNSNTTRVSIDSDVSPPRKRCLSPTREKNKRNDNKTREKHQKRIYNEDSDVSPPRKNKRKSNDSDSDLSPTRKKDRKDESNRKNNRKGNEDSDVSPPRKNKRKSNDSDSDLSPTRKKDRKDESNRKNNRKGNEDSDVSPPRKNKRKSNDSDSDLSPIRKKDRKDESNRKNKRKFNEHSDVSPPRKNKRKTNDSDSDLSPIRKSYKKVDSNRKTKKAANSSDSDLSPPRRNDAESNRRDAPKEKRSRPSRWDTERHSDSPPPTNKKMARTLEGKLAGLQDAVQLRQENESFRRREDEAFRSMADEVSGRNAQAVSRKGKRETSEDRQKQREKADRQKELDEKYKRWGRGLKQLEEREARAQHFAHEAAKPLARLAGDRDLEAARRREEHDGDPMLQYLRDRRRELRPELPKYKGNFPPNRFAIPPGYRWDGVDRSNGYEKKYFDELSNRRAREEEAFKWSTADL